LKNCLFILAFCVCCGAAFAQGHSFIYIQGDKQTPFYVKLDGVMMPRYGKNYSIVSELSPGRKHLSVLFEQNKFPAQELWIDVPADGFRALLLDRRQDKYAFYDLEQKKYLPPRGDQE